MKLLKIILILIIITPVSFAQSSSTYSRFGIGDIDYTYSARSLGLGKTGVASLSRDFVELLNPASWSQLELTRIELSLALNGVQISDKDQSVFYTDADFKGFTFAFPISTKYGIGFASGLIPYSRISYDVVQNNTGVTGPGGDHTVTYKGEGGLSMIFIGTSYRTPVDWVLGISIEYYFGKQTYSSNIDFVDPAFNSAEYETDYRSTGFGTTLGLISQDFSKLLNSKAITNLRAGISANLISKLDTDTSLTINPKTVADTILSGNTDLTMPARVTGGITLQLENEYNFNLEYIFQPWTDYKLADAKSAFLKDVHKINFGFEYVPQWEIGNSMWEQMMWRAGLSYESTQYKINGNDINQYSVFAGFSLPFSFGNTLDVGLEYSLRGTKDFNLLKENFFTINIGFSFGDLWFQRARQ
ncbi:hypothetical protein ACFLSS_01125 [Bacteroidota bacterium]